jgi:hypothetical protein
VLYADSGNAPGARKSAGESFTDFDVRAGKPAGWRSGTFSSNGVIPAGSYIWFGVLAHYYFYPRFDYGQTLYQGWYSEDFDWSTGPPVPATFPSAREQHSLKLSMYFDYSSVQAYTRTIYQGASFTDSLEKTGAFRRGLLMNAGGGANLNRAGDYCRKHPEGVSVSDSPGRVRGFLRAVTDSLKISGGMSVSRTISRCLLEAARAFANPNQYRNIRRDVLTQTGAAGNADREKGFIRKLMNILSPGDSVSFLSALARYVQDMSENFDGAGHSGDYIRGLYSKAGSGTETGHTGNFFRKEEDAATAGDITLRGLLVFARIFTTGFIRDYLIPRFLRSKEEIVLKSPVRREIFLDSRIH